MEKLITNLDPNLGATLREQLGANFQKIQNGVDGQSDSLNKQILDMLGDVPLQDKDEVTQARVDSSGKAYSTLKGRLDSQQSSADTALKEERAIGLEVEEARSDSSGETFDDLKSRLDSQESKIDNRIDNKLAQISSVPETFTNLAALKNAYPNGRTGIFVTADNGHKYIWANNTWTDAGVYQAIGIADGSVTGKQIANNSIQADKLEDVFIKNLVKLPNQTPMRLSVKTFTRPVPDPASGFVYIQHEPVLGHGSLKFSVVANLAGDYNFYMLEKIYIDDDNFKMKITAAETVTLTAGLNEFQSSLTASGGVTYYGMQIKNGTPMQRLDKDYPPAFASNAAVKGEIGEEFAAHEAINTETEGFFAELENQIDVKSMENITQRASNFLTNGAALNFDPENAAVILKPTKPTGTSLQKIDKDIFAFWGIRLANQDKQFNGFNVRVALNTLNYKNQRYRYCGIVKNLTTGVSSYSFVDINPMIDFSQPQMICFKFDQHFSLSDDLIIGVSIVDLNNQVTCTNSTGVVLTDGLDDNLFNDGINLKNSLYYTTSLGDVKDMTWINKSAASVKKYCGLDYQLLDGDITLNYSILDSTINAKLVDLSQQTKNIGAANRSYNTLKFRPTQGNFSDNPDVYFLGRWFKTDAGIMTINQGAEIDARFTGTSLAADVNALATLPCLAYSIDGQPFERVQMTQSGVTSLATGLDSGSHYVRLIMDGVKENDDLWVGHKGIVFNQFIVDDDRTIKTTPIRPVNKVGWFIGDSITAGINVLGNGANPTVNSATGAYSFIASNELNLTNIRIAFGATGIIKGGSGGVPAVSSYLDYAVSGVAEQVQDYPDLIVINHGTNDYDAAAPDFVAKYREFLHQINSKMPGTPIFVMVPFNGVFAANFKDIVSGYPTVNLIDTTGWAIAGPNTGHPDLVNSQTAGLKLAAELRSILGDGFFK